jgi:hypothetical protein
MRFESVESSIKDVDEQVKSNLEPVTKHMSFDGNGIIIVDSDNVYSIQLDNTTGVTIRKNGEIRSQLIDNNFFAGNIVIEVERRAQFGNFAFVPRNDGSLSFFKVGG